MSGSADNFTAGVNIPFCDKIDGFIRRVGSVICWANALLVVVIILQVVLRYGFGRGQVVLEELQWHLYAVGIMFGISYCMTLDSHIRVDIFYMHFSPRLKAAMEIFGILVFLAPFIYVVADHSIDFFYDSWRLNERSDAPIGLPWRWVIKGVIPVSFGLLAMATLTRFIRSVAVLTGKGVRNDD